MEKDNMKENETKSEIEESEVQTSNSEDIEAATKEETEVAIESELQYLTSEESDDKAEPCGKNILASALDQLIIVACSSVLVVLCDLILKAFGYMFVRENGALILAGGIAYFIINCFYVPVIQKSRLKNTIARKILNI